MEVPSQTLLRRLGILLIAAVIGAIGLLLYGLVLCVSWNSSAALFPHVPEITWAQSNWFVLLVLMLRPLLSLNTARGTKKNEV